MHARLELLRAKELSQADRRWATSCTPPVGCTSYRWLQQTLALFCQLLKEGHDAVRSHLPRARAAGNTTQLLELGGCTRTTFALIAGRNIPPGKSGSAGLALLAR
jgi:hypothetical protein